MFRSPNDDQIQHTPLTPQHTPVWLLQDEANNKKNKAYGGKRLPIVYSAQYAVKFYGLEKLHPFDPAKARHIMKYLIAKGTLEEGQFFEPEAEVTEEELLKVHTREYLRSLRWSINVAKIAESPLMMFIPNRCVQTGYLRPMRFQTAGTLMAGKIALERGFAINLGGGFHHCSAEKGKGFCPFADVTMLVRKMLDEEPKIKTAMIVDLDAHQGNGYERDFRDNESVYIVDIYNGSIYPRDFIAKLGISCGIELRPYTRDHHYIHKLRSCLATAMDEFKPNIVVYNAGTDVLQGDPLGMLSLTPACVIERDEMVIKAFRSLNIPVVMVLSGGYTRASAKVIADSIINLIEKRIIGFK